MSTIQQKIHEIFSELSIFRSTENESFFAGRNLPSFVKHFILLKYTDPATGVVDEQAVSDYLEQKMPVDYSTINSRLLAGESINMTTRFIVDVNLKQGQTLFEAPDAKIKNGVISPTLIEDLRKRNVILTSGETWGNISIQYVAPVGKKAGYTLMTEMKPFQPYKVDLNYYLSCREQFTTEEWIDVLIASMEYNPESFASQESKLEFISRLLPFVEANLNMIELGPKGTGKSYIYNNFSKHAWMISGGNTSRARLFYNKSTKQYGVICHYDAVALDEIESFQFADPQEMQSILKGYLEAGKAAVDNVLIQSEAGLVLMGNILLTQELQPKQSEYFRELPEMFRESATIDRFHAFIEGWLLPRLSTASILRGWTINAEYVSTILHQLRYASEYSQLFDDLVAAEEGADLRDTKAVRKVATAYSKLLFPHIRSIADVAEEDLDNFRQLYDEYCLQPAIRRRSIIRHQCHLIDPEFSDDMPIFEVYRPEGPLATEHDE